MLAWVIIILLLALLFGGLGFTAHILWWIAVILFVVFLVGVVSGPRRGWWGNR